MASATWFDPRLTIGNILVMITVVIGIVSGWYSFDTRVAIQSTRIETLESTIARLERGIDEQGVKKDDLTARVIRIEEKLSGQQEILQRILMNTEQNRRSND